MSLVNLLPDHFIEQRKLRQHTKRVVAVGALAMGVAAIGWLPLLTQTVTLNSTLRGLEQELSTRQTALEQGRALDQQTRAIHLRLDLVDELTEPVRVNQALALLTMLAPEAMAFDRVEVKAIRPKPEPADEDKKASRNSSDEIEPHELELTLQGVAPSDREIVRFVERLDEHGLFSEVLVPDNRQTTQEGLIVRAFRLELKVDLTKRFEMEAIADAHP